LPRLVKRIEHWRQARTAAKQVCHAHKSGGMADISMGRAPVKAAVSAGRIALP